MFLQSAAAHVFGDAAARQRGHAGHRDACIAVAVRDDLRPVDQPFVDELVIGLLPTLTRATCRVVRLYGNTDDLLWTLADYIRKWRLVGMVLVSVHAGDPLPELLRTAGFPAVSIGRTEADGIPFVDADNIGGARVAMAHLAGHGRRRIALLNGEVSQLAMYDRLTGYRDGLSAAGLPFDPKLVVECDGTRAGGTAAMTRLLDRSPQPDAVLVTGDLTDDGDPRSYARVRELLAPLAVPVHPIPGNHDDRDALREAFADHPGVAGSDG
jgi:DNA-binding LacI/PurR family transcriptional regulator